MIPTRQALNILEFWFGNRPYTREVRGAAGSDCGSAMPAHRNCGRRSTKRCACDSVQLAAAAARGDFDVWESSPRRRLALILLLDQFPRGIFRGSVESLRAGSPGTRARRRAARNWAPMPPWIPVERIFFYMPMQHAESRELQEESVSAFRRLAAEGPAELAQIFAAGRPARRAASRRSSSASAGFRIATARWVGSRRAEEAGMARRRRRDSRSAEVSRIALRGRPRTGAAQHAAWMQA